jgi:septum formation protein
MLILASGSSRRHELLKAAGICHLVQAASIDESRLPGEAPMDYVRRMAAEKARAVPLPAEGVVLAADTTVAVDHEIFGKPANRDEASHMLHTLSGRDHWVYTGICLLSREKCIQDVAATRVSFLLLRDAEIEEYIQSGEPFDKAGAYAIQGLASKFIYAIEGCYHNVVGLPASLVYRHLQSMQSRL